MISLPTASDIEALAKGVGLSMTSVCRRADISVSTFCRWKAGRNSPRLAIVRRILDVIEDAVFEAQAATTAACMMCPYHSRDAILRNIDGTSPISRMAARRSEPDEP